MLPSNLTETPNSHPAPWYLQGPEGSPMRYYTNEAWADMERRSHVAPDAFPEPRSKLSTPAPVPITVSKVSQRICPHCGDAFTPPYPKSTKRYCGQTCASAANGAKRRPPELPPRPCAHCGSQFTPGNPNQQYCGKSCRVNAWRLRAAIAKVCLVCGVPFSTTDSRVETCGKDCHYQLMSARRNVADAKRRAA